MTFLVLVACGTLLRGSACTRDDGDQYFYVTFVDFESFSFVGIARQLFIGIVSCMWNFNETISDWQTEIRREYLAEMYAREAQQRRRANARNCSDVCMQIKGNKDEFAASGEIRMAANKRHTGGAQLNVVSHRRSTCIFTRIWFRDTESTYGEEQNIVRQSVFFF